MSGAVEGEDDRSLPDVILDALNAWLGSGMVTAFHLIADFVDEDGDECYVYSTPDGQTHARTLGLIQWAQRLADHDVKVYLEDGD